MTFQEAAEAPLTEEEVEVVRASLARYGNKRGRWRSIAAHHLHGRSAAALPRLWKEALGALLTLRWFPYFCGPICISAL